jgi:hypothetical protein
LALVVALVACGGSGGSAQVAEDDAPAGPPENGAPMPAASRAGGVPPYPTAFVWKRHERLPSEFDTMEAFTRDSFIQVVAWYDSALGGWRRTVATDAVHYHRDPNLVAVIVSPWEGEDVPDWGPEELKQARTSIGVAWKKDLQPGPEAGT